MADHDESVAEPLFRASKRRKIFRKRTDPDSIHDKDQQDRSETNARPAENDHGDGWSEQGQRALLAQRKSVTRKYGIGFSSIGRPQAQAQEQQPENEERAIIPMHPDRQQKIEQVNRFVKPTGKVEVVDDKHMYVAQCRQVHGQR